MYAIVEKGQDGFNDAISLIDPGHIASSMDCVVISLDRPYDDEKDTIDALSYCGKYTGQ